MSLNDHYRRVDKVTVTEDQRIKFLDLLKAEPSKGHVAALREAGVEGTAGQLRAFLTANEQLAADVREVKGQHVEKLEAVRWDVALDKTHSAWEKANLTLLARLDPGYRTGSRVELTGADGGPVVLSHEQRLTLADVAALANEINRPGASTRGELPAAGEVLAPADDR